MAQTKKHYYHFDVWTKAGKQLGYHFTEARFSLRTPEKLMVTSIAGIVREKQEKLVADEYLLVTVEQDARWKSNGYAYINGVRNRKYDINLAAYA